MSSKIRRSLPSYILTYSSFKINVRAFPIWRGPEGKGASLIITFLISAFGNSFNPFLIFLLEVLEFNFSSSFCCFSGDIELTFFRVS